MVVSIKQVVGTTKTMAKKSLRFDKFMFRALIITRINCIHLKDKGSPI